jgi:hypothetical protein
VKEPFYPQTLAAWLQSGSVVLTAITVAFAALGIASAAWKYDRSRVDRRVDETFKFIDAFDGQHLSAAQRSIDRITMAALDKASAAAKGASHAGTAESEIKAMEDRQFIEEIFDSDLQSPGDLPSPVLDITSFFGGIQSCVEQNLCDAATAHAFLDPYAQSLWKTYLPVVSYARQSNRAHFATGLERFVKASTEGQR